MKLRPFYNHTQFNWYGDMVGGISDADVSNLYIIQGLSLPSGMWLNWCDAKSAYNLFRKIKIFLYSICNISLVTI